WEILHHDLKIKAFHYTIVHGLKPNDPLLRKQVCELFLEMRNIDPNIVQQVMFSDEATFHLSGRVNSCAIWGTENPHAIVEFHRDSPKLNVWCGVSATGVIGSYFFPDPTVNSHNYLHMLENFTLDEMPIAI